MEKLKLYVVTKGSTDGYVEEGDLVWLSQNRDLNSVRCKGLLEELEWDQPNTNDFEVEESEEYYLDIYKGVESVRKKVERDVPTAPIKFPYSPTDYVYKCRSCKSIIHKFQNFCSRCGQKILWED